MAKTKRVIKPKPYKNPYGDFNDLPDIYGNDKVIKKKTNIMSYLIFFILLLISGYIGYIFIKNVKL